MVFGQSSFSKTFELSQLNGVNGFQINGIAAKDFSGWSVSGAGDVNGDGYADVIIGARYASPEGRTGAGESYVVFGRSSFGKTFELSQLNGANGFQINGIATKDFAGWSVSGAGDVNQDGYADIIIGAYDASPNGRDGAGESYVVFGRSSFGKTFELSQLNGANGFQVNGIAAYDLSGWSVSGAGDVNGDGYADIIIGAEDASPSGRTQAGESYVVFGQSRFNRTVELSALNGANGFQMNGIASGDHASFVSDAGDVNKDGYGDIIIGAYYASPEGRIHAGESYVVFGQPSFNKTLELSQLNGANGFQINGIAYNDQAGCLVSGTGDVNKDGYDDVIIGAGASPNGIYEAGESYVVFGQSRFSKTFELSQLNGVNGFQINGIAMTDRSGIVSGAGDVNKDGYSDVIIGGWGASPDGRYQAGESYVVYGGGGLGVSANPHLASFLKNEKEDVSYSVSEEAQDVKTNGVDVLREAPEAHSQNEQADLVYGQGLLDSVTSRLKGSYEQSKHYLGFFWKTNTVENDNIQNRAFLTKEASRLKELRKIEVTLKTLRMSLVQVFRDDSASLTKVLDFYQDKVTNWQVNVRALSTQDMIDLKEDVMKLESRVYGTQYVPPVETWTESKRTVGFFEPRHVKGGVQAPMLAQGNPLQAVMP